MNELKIYHFNILFNIFKSISIVFSSIMSLAMLQGTVVLSLIKAIKNAVSYQFIVFLYQKSFKFSLFCFKSKFVML